MKATVVYYSRFGHTAKVAQALAQELDAEVQRIEETKQRGYPGMGWGPGRAAREFANKVKGAAAIAD